MEVGEFLVCLQPQNAVEHIRTHVQTTANMEQKFSLHQNHYLHTFEKYDTP
jgi:hypothetical protein